MTPEEISYVREWAKGGNDARFRYEVSAAVELVTTSVLTGPGVVLNHAGLAIAHLAEDLALAREVLREVDFRTNGTSDPCPCCSSNFYDKDHEPDCKLKKALGG